VLRSTLTSELTTVPGAIGQAWLACAFFRVERAQKIMPTPKPKKSRLKITVAIVMATSSVLVH
jgi:hypothetical protein